jgi:hypothetical protein
LRLLPLRLSQGQIDWEAVRHGWATICWSGSDCFRDPKWPDFTSLCDLAGKIANMLWYARELHWVNAAFLLIWDLMSPTPVWDSDSISNTRYQRENPVLELLPVDEEDFFWRISAIND